MSWLNRAEKYPDKGWLLYGDIKCKCKCFHLMMNFLGPPIEKNSETVFGCGIEIVFRNQLTFFLSLPDE